MGRRLLLTSFTTWKPEQVSNASDDLLEILQAKTADWADSLAFVRRLPVDFEEAPRHAIAHIHHHQPDGVVCFGMAETRDRIDLEQQAIVADERRQTRLNLHHLSQGLSFTRISDDAGAFVCNHLYFAVLGHLQPTSAFALFIHVPVLTEDNRAAVVHDSWEILRRLHQLDAVQPLALSSPV